jgi:hypothetical protein
MSNPILYVFDSWQPDAGPGGADSNHPVATDPMNDGSSNAADAWVRQLESNMRIQSINKQWEYWLGINAPNSPSPNAPGYISTTQFSLTGDWTSPSPGFYPAIAIVGRRVKAYTSANPSPIGVTGTITAASYVAPTTTVTVLWDSTGLDSGLTEVQFGVPYSGSGGALPVSASGTFFGTASGTNTYAVTLASSNGQAPSSQAALLGQPIVVKFTNANSGAATLNANGFGAQPMTNYGATALVGTEIPAGGEVVVVWDGTEYQIQNIGNPLAVANGGTGTTTGAPHGMQYFSSSGTFTVPTGVYSFNVEVWGAGGGGGGGGAGFGTGGGGGVSNVVGSGPVTEAAANGGSGGTGSNSGVGVGGVGASGTTGALKITGGTGNNAGSGAGSSSYGGASARGAPPNASGSGNTPGAGGIGFLGQGGGGGGGGYAFAQVTTTPGSTFTVTIGAGGTAGAGAQPGQAGGAGGAFFVW